MRTGAAISHDLQPSFRRLASIAFSIALTCAIAGCQKASQEPASSPSSQSKASVVVGRTVPAQLTGYNHTDKSVGAFYVNGEWGGNITAGSGGGKFVCCVELPVPWHAGLTAKISWEVAVPEYDPKTLSGFNVHFLRSGEIKVFANRMSLWHPDYPLKGEEAELKPGVPIVPLPRS